MRSLKWQYVTLAVIIAGFTIFYALNIGRFGLWADEGLSLYDASQLNFNYPVFSARPLYYLLLHLWMKWGSSDAYLRSLSALFSLLTIVSNFWLARSIFGAATGLLSSFLLGVVPLFIATALQLRMYSLGLLLGTLGTGVLIASYQRSSRYAVAAWALLRWASLLANPFNFTLLAADLILIVCYFRKHRFFRTFVAGCLLVSILWLPNVRVLGSGNLGLEWLEQLTKPDLRGVIETIFVAIPLGLIDARYYALTLILGAYWVYLSWQNPRIETKFIGLSAVMPPLLIFALTMVSKNSYWILRYLIPCLPFLMILISHGMVVACHKSRWLGVTLGLIYTAVLVSEMPRWATKGIFLDQQWREAAQVIKRRWRPGDVVIGDSLRSNMSTVHYLPRHIPFRAFPVTETLQTRPSELTAVFNELPGPVTAVWILHRHPSEILIDGRRIEQFIFRGVRLARLAKKPIVNTQPSLGAPN